MARNLFHPESELGGDMEELGRSRCQIVTPSGEAVTIEGTCSIGRMDKNTIPIDDTDVSRRHALIHQHDANGVWIVDLGSRNGVIVNCMRINGPTRLHDQDRIRISDHEFRFRNTFGRTFEPEEGAETTCGGVASLKTVEVWVMLIQITYLTGLEERMHTRALGQRVGQWFQSLRGLVDRCDGTVNKYLGDGLLICWPGSVEPAEQISGMLGQLGEIGGQVGVMCHAVVHLGDVTFDGEGSLERSEIRGTAVDYVDAMESLGTVGSEMLIASEAAAVALLRHVNLNRLGLLQLPHPHGAATFYGL